jgi:hypothetical protein
LSNCTSFSSARKLDTNTKTIPTPAKNLLHILLFPFPDNNKKNPPQKSAGYTLFLGPYPRGTTGSIGRFSDLKGIFLIALGLPGLSPVALRT